MPKKRSSNVVARLTMTQKDGRQFVVEVWDSAGFRDFFRWYRKEKGKRNKVFLRGEQRQHPAKGLDFIAQRTKKTFTGLDTFARKVGRGVDNTWARAQIVTCKIVVYKKAEYTRLLNCPTNELPGYKPVIVHSPMTERKSSYA